MKDTHEPGSVKLQDSDKQSGPGKWLKGWCIHRLCLWEEAWLPALELYGHQSTYHQEEALGTEHLGSQGVLQCCSLVLCSGERKQTRSQCNNPGVNEVALSPS